MAGRAKRKRRRGRRDWSKLTFRQLFRGIFVAALRVAGAAAAVFLFFAILYTVVPPPTTAFMLAEAVRQGGYSRDWVPLEDMAPDAALAVVAAEDANFCLHWGFDISAIREAIGDGGNRGASTLSQQVVKNVFLWHGRSWTRKALEAVMTPVTELIWTKRRIVEVYLNVAEMGPGIFGIEAAAQHWFGVSAAELSPVQAARIAAILPDPKDRNPARPSGFVRQRARAILAGAETIAADGRAGCFLAD